ncbi:transposase family protein, partial [Streptomyces cyaneofuscatus]|uniref:transposase family protein n=1 Tax=Streptomyces cyaneofuscatus TaxID=66883 RepID=UPI00364F8E4D
RALIALVYLRRHDTLARIASAFAISAGTAHAYGTAVTGLLAEQAPGLLKTLRAHDPDFILLDGTLAECDRVGDRRADYSSKHKRHGVNVQVVTDPGGEILWLSPALPGRTHDLTAARNHKILRICARQGVPILADMAYIGAGDWVTAAKHRPPGGELTTTEQTANRALSAARVPVERGMARLKSRQIFRRSRISPNRMSVIAQAVLTLERQR